MPVWSSQVVEKIKNCQPETIAVKTQEMLAVLSLPVLRANEGGNLQVFYLWLVEDVHEGDPQVGSEEVPDCRPELSPDQGAALLEQLFPDDPR